MVIVLCKMPKKIQVKVVKVPLSRDEKPRDRPAVFPRMPRLYLELLENKSKIKQDLINKEYVPTDEPVYEQRPQMEFIENSTKPSEKSTPPRRDKRKEQVQVDSDSDSDVEPTVRPVKKSDFDSRLDKLLDNDNSGDESDDESDKSSPALSDVSNTSERSIKEKHSDNSYDDSEASSDDLSERLKELLNDDGDDNSSVDSLDKLQKSIGRNRDDKYSRHRDKQGHTLHRGDSPPTLAELEAQGGYTRKQELRDINQPSMNEQEEEDAKRELMFKFDLLKKSYPNAVIPEFSIHSDYVSMKKTYDSTVKRLSLDSSVESYKTYLIGGFMAVEFIFGNFLGFDMQGFTQQQIVSMHSYDKLLIELGEKSYVPSGSKWPVELRLLFLVIMNAAFFIISKMIMKKTGANLMGMINNMNTSRTPAPAPARKRRMRGPNIDLDDIPDLDG